ncbi:17284_t:CDS:1, partial [Cetraspora pellucida]
IDQFATDHSSLSCKVIEKTNNQQYRLGYKYGIINAYYSAGELEILEVAVCSELDKISSEQISLQEAAKLQSVGLVSSSFCNCKELSNSKKCNCKK